jgi:hypothetical protein
MNERKLLSNGGAQRGGPGDCLLDFAIANAGSANAHALPGTFHHGMNGLQVQIPAALGYVMSVAHAVAILRSTTA